MKTTDERLIGAVLRAGVILSAVITAVGLGLSLLHAGAPPSREIIVAGLLVLVATPIIRVALLVGIFAVERDRLYAGVSAFVLAVLLIAVARA